LNPASPVRGDPCRGRGITSDEVLGSETEGIRDPEFTTLCFVAGFSLMGETAGETGTEEEAAESPLIAGVEIAGYSNADIAGNPMVVQMSRIRKRDRYRIDSYIHAHLGTKSFW
jgi:hypothetical protein